MHTPESPESIEAGLTKFMEDLPKLLAGKTPRQKQMILGKLLHDVIFSVEHESFGYWTMSTPFGSGIFSLERHTFLEFPEGKGVKKYFSNITSKGVVPLSDGSHILTFIFGGDRITPKEILRIEKFCFIENGIINTLSTIPSPCSLQMALNIFQTKKNEEIARKKGEV